MPSAQLMTKIKTKSSRWWSLFQNSAKLPFILALKNNAHLCHQSTEHVHPLKGLFSNQTIVGIKPKRIFLHNTGYLPGNQLISQLSLAAQKPRDRCSGCSVMETLDQDPSGVERTTASPPATTGTGSSRGIRSVTQQPGWVGSCTQTTSLPAVAFFSLQARPKGNSPQSQTWVTDLGMEENWGSHHKSETTRPLNNDNNNSSHNSKSTTMPSADGKVTDRKIWLHVIQRKSLRVIKILDSATLRLGSSSKKIINVFGQRVSYKDIHHRVVKNVKNRNRGTQH